MSSPKHYPWSDKNLSPDQRADLVIKEMTLDEKIQLLHGLGWQVLFAQQESGPATRAISTLGFIPGVPRLGIPDLQMTDSVEGVSGAGVKGRYATALPSAEAMAAAWDPALSYEIGTLLGHEMRAMGFNMSLGSGINMIREPRNGRTFEYKGEDPLLAGTLAGQELKAEKALHLITDVKHFAVNDQDSGRIVVNSIISKRAMRESDLLAFQIALKDSGAGAVMCFLQPHQWNVRMRKRLHAGRTEEGFRIQRIRRIGLGRHAKYGEGSHGGSGHRDAGQRLIWGASEEGRGERRSAHGEAQ